MHKDIFKEIIKIVVSGIILIPFLDYLKKVLGLSSLNIFLLFIAITALIALIWVLKRGKWIYPKMFWPGRYFRLC